VSLNRNAKGMHSCVSMATISGYIVESYVYVHNNNIQGMHCCVSIATVVTGTHHNVRLYVRGGADKSLTLQGRKQATATKLGIYLTYSPRSSVHFLACVSNFCKPLKKKKFRRLSIHRGLRGSSDLRVGRKMAIFNFFQSREQVVVRRGQIRRIGWVIKTTDHHTGSPGRLVSSGLQVPGEPGHCPRTRPPW